VGRLPSITSDHQNTMQVIGHDDKFIQPNILPNRSRSPPFFFNDLAYW
jgi:hypothetical protein